MEILRHLSRIRKEPEQIQCPIGRCTLEVNIETLDQPKQHGSKVYTHKITVEAPDEGELLRNGTSQKDAFYNGRSSLMERCIQIGCYSEGCFIKQEQGD